MRGLNRALRRLPEWAVWLLGAIPLALLVADIVTGNLGIDPVRDVEHRLGRTALYFLMGSLAVTPALRILRLNAMKFRRALGLLAFSYAVLHVAAWVALDMGFLWGQMGRDVLKRPYLVMGMIAVVILLALAVTSNRASIRRMGRGWHWLHRLSYAAVVLACLHWLYALKLWGAWPLGVAAVILLLLVLRIPARRLMESFSPRKFV